MNENSGLEPQLSPDFALRVLDAADRVLARRQRLRRIAGASALCVGIAAIIAWPYFTAAPQRPDRKPLFASADPAPLDNESAASPAEQASAPDALSWFFPDAAPLSRYAAEDRREDGAGSAGGLFADDE